MGFILESKEDNSVNFVTDGTPGKIECRYVHRNQEKLNCYLSSQTGCKQACRMCFLTQTGQTQVRDVTAPEYMQQAHKVLEYYKEHTIMHGEAYKVHYDFMARGDVFANKKFWFCPEYILRALGHLAADYDLLPLYKLSTIMPLEMGEKDLAKEFGAHNPDIYYSLYSIDPEFRKHWMPKAMPPEDAFRILKNYQKLSNKIITLHWAFIEGQNDTEEGVDNLCDFIVEQGLRTNINIVRYNPFSEKFGRETEFSKIQELLAIMQQYLPESRFKVVDRVGLMWLPPVVCLYHE